MRRIPALEGLRGAAIVVVLAALVVPRFATLRQGLWHDEIYTVQHYISGGPQAIFGSYGPNDHMLFSLLGWATVRLPDAPDALYRLWAILPFLAGVAVVVWWLRQRAGGLAAFVFALLAAASPELLELTSEARGYGLAFFAMAVMIVAGDKAVSGGRRWLDVFAAAAVVGAWTLPTFVLPVIGAALGLAGVSRTVRRSLVARACIAAVAVGAWYAPTLSRILHATGQQFGRPLPWHAPITGPFELFSAAFIPGFPPTPAKAVATVVLAPLLLAGARLLLATMQPVAALAGGAVTVTFVGLTVSRFAVDARFLSYLLAPLFVCAACGAATLLRQRRRGVVLAFAYSGAVALVFVVQFLTVGPAMLTHPFEATRDAAAAVKAADPGSKWSVLANVHHPADLRYYLPKTTRLTRGTDVCRARTPFVFVQQPYHVRLADPSCLSRDGLHPRRFAQRARGGEIIVWLPAA